MSYLSNIKKFSAADNLGGLLTILIIRKEEVESITPPRNGVVYGTITLKAGKSFVSWEVTQESPRAKSMAKNGPEGSSRSNGINFLIPKDRPEIKDQLDRAEEDEFIILFTDSNAKQKIFGLIETPVRFEYDHDSGAALANLNSYDCRFYYDGPDNLFHYNGSIPSPAPGASPSIVKWNGGVIASLNAGEQINFVSEFGYTEFFIST